MKELARSTIARLLATENITVVQDNVRTASFDVKNRILRLPSWSDVAPYTEDHLIGHEVGHALYTPLDGWHEAVCTKGAAYKSYLNVVEDARIEKLIQRKYPGLRTSFIKSYRKLLADGFFGGQLDDINKMSLIDRINVYFKCGLMSGVKFNDDERQWLPRIDAAETWEDVVAIVDELYGQAKEEIEQQQEQMQIPDEGDEDGEDSDDFDMEAGESPLDLDDDDYHGEQDGPGTPYGDPEDGEEYFDEDANGADGMGGGKSNPDTEPKSKTDETLRDAIDREMNTDHQGQVHNLTLARITNSEDYIITYKKIFDLIDSGQDNIRENLDPLDSYHADVIKANKYTAAEQLALGEKLFDRWRQNNQKSVNTLVKEFEMRKSASEYARATIAKTGVIDTVKMNKYKLTDDIFRKVTVVPEGKNHGFIMYMDMSGSMNEYMFETVEQTIMLAHFCKQIGVPFRVFGFTDALAYGEKSLFKGDKKPNLVMPDDDLRLLELFSERMNKMEMSRMAKHLLGQYAYTSKALSKSDRGLWREARWMSQLGLFRLGGTPLNSALTVGIDFANKFRKDHRLDVINTFLLTDGESHCQDIVMSDRGWGNNIRNLAWQRDNYITLTSPYTKKTHRLGMKHGDTRMDEFDLMTQIYKEATGSKVIGYKITPNGSAAYGREIRQLTGEWDDGTLRKAYLKEGYTKFDDVIGHDEMYVISVKSLTPAPNKLDDVEAGASKMKLRSAFKASGQNAKKTRKMLTDLSKVVA